MADDLTRRVFLGSAGAAIAAGSVASAASQATGDQKAGSGPVKILAVCCSPRKGKSTAQVLKECLKAAQKVDNRIEIELIELGGLDIEGSVAAGIEMPENRKDDFLSLIPKLSDPKVRGIIIGTPVYFSSMTSLCKAFIERLRVFWRKDTLTNKVVGVVSVGASRNGGQEVTIRSVQDSLFCFETVVGGSGRPTARFGAGVWSKDGKPLDDKYGMNYVKNLGRRVAEVALTLAK